MKKNTLLLPVLVVFTMLFTNPLKAQDTLNHKKKQPKIHIFIDKDGDGYNDNAPDDDGDGIPNRLDPDWYKNKKSNKHKNLDYIDLNGDGINDYQQNIRTGKDKIKMNGIPLMDKGGSVNSKTSSPKGKMKKGGKR